MDITSDVIKSCLRQADTQMDIILFFLKTHQSIILHPRSLSLPDRIRDHSHGVDAVAYLKQFMCY